MGKRKQGQGPTDEPMRIELAVAADFVPEDGDAFDAVVAAMDFAEIPARITLLGKGRFESALEPMAAISTEHLSEATLERLLAGGEAFEGLIHYPNEYGAFLVINQFGVAQSEPQAWPDTWPEDLAELMSIAKAEGLKWIKLDVDAPQIEGVPVYPRADGEAKESRQRSMRRDG
ncbi:MAG TPA: hypothetical protein VN259_07535 [Xanthomonadales bacterium]|nr:hypothetical protein [Xanthomonadales bacterium]